MNVKELRALIADLPDDTEIKCGASIDGGGIQLYQPNGELMAITESKISWPAYLQLQINETLDDVIDGEGDEMTIRGRSPAEMTELREIWEGFKYSYNRWASENSGKLKGAYLYRNSVALI